MWVNASSRSQPAIGLCIIESFPILRDLATTASSRLARLLVGPQGVVERRVGHELARQRDGVLDRHAGAHRRERGGGVRRVAQQHDAPVGLVHEVRELVQRRGDVRLHPRAAVAQLSDGAVEDLEGHRYLVGMEDADGPGEGLDPAAVGRGELSEDR